MNGKRSAYPQTLHRDLARFPAETAVGCSASVRRMIQLTDSHCDETHTCNRTHSPSVKSQLAVLSGVRYQSYMAK